MHRLVAPPRVDNALIVQVTQVPVYGHGKRFRAYPESGA